MGISTWSGNGGEKCLAIAKRALIASDKFPVIVHYDNTRSTDDNIIYTIYHLKKLGYGVSNVHQVTIYLGNYHAPQTSTIMNIDLLKSCSLDGLEQL